jgi:hypothetical protein
LRKLIEWTKCSTICTDVAPALTGKNIGFVAKDIGFVAKNIGFVAGILKLYTNLLKFYLVYQYRIHVA